MVKKDKITVLMPVYNSKKHLCEAIDSILNQSYTNFEFLIINDGSTDGSADILERYQKQDSRIRVIYQENAGISAALNRGLQESKTDLIARMDADDIAMTDRLEKQADYMDEHPNTVVVGTAMKVIDENGKGNKIISHSYDPRTLKNQTQRHCRLAHPSVMYRRESVLKVGGYRSLFIAAQDFDLWLRLSEVGDIANLPDVLLYYRWHGNNISIVKGRIQRRDHAIAIESAKCRLNYGKDPINHIHTLNDNNDVLNAFQEVAGLHTKNRVKAVLNLADVPEDLEDNQVFKALSKMFLMRWNRFDFMHQSTYLEALGSLTKTYSEAFKEKRILQACILSCFYLLLHPCRALNRNIRWAQT